MSSKDCRDCGSPFQDSTWPYQRCHRCHVEWEQLVGRTLVEPKPPLTAGDVLEGARLLKIDEANAKLYRDGHWTFPDDPETKPRPGWGPFKFDWLLKPFQPFVEWHDRVTTINSKAQQIGVTNKQIVEYTRKQLELLADKPRNGFQKRLAWGVGFFLAHVNRFFYEGPL